METFSQKPLDEYVKRPDANYKYELISDTLDILTDVRILTYNLTSQRWRTGRHSIFFKRLFLILKRSPYNHYNMAHNVYVEHHSFTHIVLKSTVNDTFQPIRYLYNHQAHTNKWIYSSIKYFKFIQPKQKNETFTIIVGYRQPLISQYIHHHYFEAMYKFPKYPTTSFYLDTFDHFSL